MNDLWNFIIAVAAAIILGYTIRRRRTVATSVSAFIIGMAFHSILLHEKIRQGWRFSWDHDENQ